MGFNHFDSDGNAWMVDVSGKDITSRTATATGAIRVSGEVIEAVLGGTAKKGDVLGVARIAGIMAVKHTSDLIPLTHPLPITKCTVEFKVDEVQRKIHAFCTVKTDGKTGVEMEALTGVNVALLAVYDMCKAMDKRMCMEGIHLCEKTGGKSGQILYGPDQPVLSVVGVKNSGKTLLIERLIPALAAKGIKTAVIKKGCEFTPDTPGTDTFRFFQAGACGTVIFDGSKYSMTRDLELDKETMTSMFPEADLVLIEGMKKSDAPKFEIINPDDDRSPVFTADQVLAYAAAEGNTKQTDVGSTPVFDRNDIDGIADFIEKLYKDGSLVGAVL